MPPYSKEFQIFATWSRKVKIELVTFLTQKSRKVRLSPNLNFADLGVGLEIPETKAEESCGMSSSPRVQNMRLCGTLFIEISNWRESGPK